MPLFSVITLLHLVLLPPAAVLGSIAMTGYKCTGNDSNCTISTKPNGGVCEIEAAGLPPGSHLHIRLTGNGSQHTINYDCFGIETSHLHTCNVKCTDGCVTDPNFTTCFPDSGGGGSNSGGGGSNSGGGGSNSETVYVCLNNEYCIISSTGGVCSPIGQGLPFGTNFMPTLIGVGSGQGMAYDCIGIENSNLASNGGSCVVACPDSCTQQSDVTSFTCSSTSDNTYYSSSAGRAVAGLLVVGLAAAAAGILA
jgi:hypothetical protein